jgi:multidrug efflux pump
MPVIFLQGFVGRLFREFGVVIAGAVLISAFVSLTLTPMLSARLIRKDKKHSRFYELTEPFFEKLIAGYRNSLQRFMVGRRMAFFIFGAAIVLIFLIGKSLQSELSPLEDRSWLRMLVTGPEGASYDYTDNFLQKLSDIVADSVPEKSVMLTVTAPALQVREQWNTGFVRLALLTPDKRKRSQQQIADQLSGMARQMTEAKVFVVQEQTISAGGGRAGALPVQYVVQNQEFSKLEKFLPKFMEEANKSKIFQGTDVNLKFNKPELSITIDREKARSMGISVSDIAQTLQLALSGQRFGYFIMQGKQYQVIGQVDRSDRDDPV